MFIKDKLLFADWIFNGHGADVHSLVKQIHICREKYTLKQFFPPGIVNFDNGLLGD